MKRMLTLGLLFVLFGSTAWAQTATVTGVVTDADTDETLPGANVFVVGTTQGTATDLDGRYALDLAPGTYTLTFSFTGYQNQNRDVTLAAGETQTLDVALASGIELDPIQVTAGRKQEKVLDAPASISVLAAREVERSVGTSSVEALRDTPGVDMAQTGVDRREVVLRGFNNAFSGAAYILTDYRQAAVPSLAVNIHSIMPNMNVDVERIEVVRGPGSALYGAGVDAGVIHYFTKDPFTYPGVTVAVSGGEQSFFNIQGRVAGVVAENLGYKVTGTYGQADDWELDPNDPTDVRQMEGDVIPRQNDFQKLNLNGSLEYRFDDQTSLIVNGGYSDLTATVLSGIGTLQADGFGYSYGQVRFQRGTFFAQAYMNKNDAGNSFVYDQDLNGDGEPDPVTDNGVLYNAQAQYDLNLADGREELIFGVDLQLTRPDTDGTILGRNEDDDNINEYGAYVQSTTAITSQFELTAALRGDYNSVNEVFRLSPRAAVVYKPASGHSVRATYNLAFSSPGTNSNFLDIVARSPDAMLPFAVRGRGAGQGFTWERDPAFGAIAPTDLVASSLIGCVDSQTGLPRANPAPTCGADTPQGLFLGPVYAQMYAGLNAIPNAQLAAVLQQQGIPVNEQVVAQLKALLDPQLTQVEGFAPGLLGILNVSTGMVDRNPADLTDIEPLKQTITQTVELGYKGLINNRLLVALDGYYSQKENFVGPLLMETPFVIVPTVRGALRDAIAEGISGNAQLAGALSAFGVSAAAAADLLVNLASDQLPSGSSPVAIVQPAENNPGEGEIPELMLSYRNFGQIEYWGIDASVQFIANERLNLFGNISIVSDDFFDNEELGEENPSLSLALNAPTFKAKFGGSYDMANGLSVNASGRYIEGFPVQSGPYVGGLPEPYGDGEGGVESTFLLDLGAGYDFMRVLPGLRFDLGISNVLDEDYRYFLGAPKIGRMAIARLTYTVQ